MGYVTIGKLLRAVCGQDRQSVVCYLYKLLFHSKIKKKFNHIFSRLNENGLKRSYSTFDFKFHGHGRLEIKDKVISYVLF